MTEKGRGYEAYWLAVFLINNGIVRPLPPWLGFYGTTFTGELFHPDDAPYVEEVKLASAAGPVPLPSRPHTQAPRIYPSNPSSPFQFLPRPFPSPCHVGSQSLQFEAVSPSASRFPHAHMHKRNLAT